MKIGLVVDPYGEESPGGLGRAIFEMVKALVELDRQHTYTLYFKRKPKHAPHIAGKHWHTEVFGGRYFLFGSARQLDRTLDLYIFFTPVIPLFFFPKKSIVVAHDFAYLEMSQTSLRQRCVSFMLYVAHWISFRKATSIIAVSQSTKEAVIRHFYTAPDKVHVVYNGVIALPQEQRTVSVPPHFFLFAGVLKERKNVAGIITAFAFFAKSNTTHELLIVGKSGGAYAESLRSLVRELGIERRTRFLGYVTDNELAYLYGKAEALVFPSFIEGFGMPVLEAMYAGLPVITSNEGALAEVAGDAALLVDPRSPEAIAVAMTEIVDDPALRGGLIQKGKLRAGQFSWVETARSFSTVITGLQDHFHEKSV